MRAPLVERISSSSLSWIALLSRFWVFWMRNTIKKVTIVVPVLITNCQVSEKLNIGPEINQITIEIAASINTPADPASVDARDEILRKCSFILVSITEI